MDSELENHRLNEDDLSGGTEVRLCGGKPEKGEAGYPTMEYIHNHIDTYTGACLPFLALENFLTTRV